MSFIDQNQDFVKSIYREIENKMMEYFNNNYKKPRIFEYRSSSTKAFCMPEINTKSYTPTFYKNYNKTLIIEPIAKMNSKILLVAYCPDINGHEDKLQKIMKTYQKHSVKKIRGRKDLNDVLS